jgi:hypothetical protein
LRLPERRGRHLGLGPRFLGQRVRLTIDSEVSGPWETLARSGDMYDEGVKWRKPPGSASVVELLHECGYEMRFSTKMQVLWRWQSGGVEDPRVRDSLTAILCAVGYNKVNRSVNLVLGELMRGWHHRKIRHAWGAAYRLSVALSALS